jgi:hypothetical protein
MRRNSPSLGPANARSGEASLAQLKTGWHLRLFCVPEDVEVVVLDGWLLSGYQVREELRRATRHSPTQSAVTRVQEEIGHGGAADNRCSIGCHRS